MIANRTMKAMLTPATTSTAVTVAIALLLFLLAGCAPRMGSRTIRSPLPGTLPGDRPVHLFLLAGQSNMAGRGVLERQDTLAHPRVWTLDREGRWAPAIDPIHFDKRIAGVGPGRTFGLTLAEIDSTVTIGLIPSAVGGSPIETWVPGAVHDQTGAHPYDDALARARIAMKSGDLKAILWHQGEADSNEENATAYGDRLDALIRRFRAELDEPDLPFIAGGLGRFEGKPWDRWREQVENVLESLPERVPETGFVGAEGLVHKGDSVHFDAASAREFGRRFADLYLTMSAERE